MTRRLDTATVLDALATAAEHQRPLPQALASLATHSRNPSLRAQLQNVRRDVDHGADWCESLHQRRLVGRADLAILQAARRVGNLPWALQEMADSSRRRFLYRLQSIVQLVFPVVLLSYAAVAALFVAALFTPLVELIEGLV